MNKWQIICPVTAMLLVLLTFAVIHVRNEQRGFKAVATRSIGQELIATTNSPHLAGIGPELHAQIAELLRSTTHVASVIVGDERSPTGMADGPTVLM